MSWTLQQVLAAILHCTVFGLTDKSLQTNNLYEEEWTNIHVTEEGGNQNGATGTQKSVKPIRITQEESVMACMHAQNIKPCDNCNYIRYNQDTKKCKVFAETPEKGKAWKKTSARARCLAKGFTYHSSARVCYYLPGFPVVGLAVHHFCRFHGGILLTVSSIQTKTLLSMVLHDHAFKYRSEFVSEFIWIGEVKNVRGTWMWENGERLEGSEWDQRASSTFSGHYILCRRFGEYF